MDYYCGVNAKRGDTKVSTSRISRRVSRTVWLCALIMADSRVDDGSDIRCALIHRHRPDLLDFYKLDLSDKRANTEKAFKVAEEFLGIPVSGTRKY